MKEKNGLKSVDKPDSISPFSTRKRRRNLLFTFQQIGVRIYAVRNVENSKNNEKQ